MIWKFRGLYCDQEVISISTQNTECFNYKKDCGISKSCFVLKDQSVTLNLKLSYDEWTLGF